MEKISLFTSFVGKIPAPNPPHRDQPQESATGQAGYDNRATQAAFNAFARLACAFDIYKHPVLKFAIENADI